MTASAVCSEWNIEALDVEAYVARIRYADDLTPSSHTLRRLHRAHVTSIPFENLEIVLGRPVPLDLPGLQEKLLRHRRGGYCYEHNLVFAALLERLGYAVHRLLARVHSTPGRPGPRTHMNLVVEAEGLSWLADVGFGGGILEPVQLKSGVRVSQDGWQYRLERSEDGVWRLVGLNEGVWSELYSFTRESQHQVDYEIVNYSTSTNAASPFVGQIVAMRTQEGVRHRLVGNELITSRAEGPVDRHELRADEVGPTLSTVFGIELEPTDADRLRTAQESARTAGLPARKAEGRRGLGKEQPTQGAGQHWHLLAGGEGVENATWSLPHPRLRV